MLKMMLLNVFLPLASFSRGFCQFVGLEVKCVELYRFVSHTQECLWAWFSYSSHQCHLSGLSSYSGAYDKRWYANLLFPGAFHWNTSKGGKL